MTDNIQTAPEPAAGKQVSGLPLVRFFGDRTWNILALVLIAVIGWFYGQLVETQIMGFTHDDGVYAVAAKSLSQGKGFSLLHVVGHPAQVKYPIMYPLLLTPVWLINPHFPENLPWMTWFTIAFGLAGFWFAYLFLRQCERFPGWLALLVVVLVAANFFFMYFFSMVMSEAPYFFFSFLTLYYFCRQCRKESVLSPRTVIILVLLSMFTFHTRVLGITLIAAIGTWLLMNRQWKNALVYGIGCLLLTVVPWVLWTKTQTPPMNILNYPLVNAYANYNLEFMENFKNGLAVGDLMLHFMHALLEMMFTLIPNFIKLYPVLIKEGLPDILLGTTIFGATYLLFGYFLVQVISTLRKSYSNVHFDPGVFSVPALYLCYYSLAIIFWNYSDQMTRFLAVLMPLLWLYFFKPLLPFLSDRSHSRLVVAKSYVTLVFCLLVALISLWPVPNSYQVVEHSRSQHWVESGKNKWLWNEYLATFDYIRKNIPPDAPLGAGSDVVFHLYTERPTFYVFYASLAKVKGRLLINAQTTGRLMRSLDHYGVRYLVAEPHMRMRTVQAPVNLIAKGLLDNFPDRFKLLYTSPSKVISIYEIKAPYPLPR